jgi:hypothetical protein
MGRLGTRTQQTWGFLGAAAAAWFAIWMLFFPDFVPTHFAWNVQPRFAQVVIGAGYIFRVAFFLNVAFERDWLRLRWIVWGNLVFTGVLLFATYWHAAEFLWNPFQSPVAHIWIVLYIFEPVVMIYLLPPGILRAPAPATGGPLLLLNPEFAATRWPWELNGLDARIVAAWALGWAVWCGTMAFATDWHEIRSAARLFVLNGLALTLVAIVFRDEFIPGRGSAVAFTVVIAAMTILMASFHWIQERRRPTPDPTASPSMPPP